MLQFKNKKETEKELKHIDVIFNGLYIGYIIAGTSLDKDKFVFCCKSDAHRKTLRIFKNGYYQPLGDKSIKALKDKIESLLWESM